MDAGDVLQGAEGGDLQAQTHHLIDIFPAVAAAELTEAVHVGTAGCLCFFRQVDHPQGIGRHQIPLCVQQHLEQGQEKYRPGPVKGPPVLGLRAGEQGASGKVIGKKEPSLLRLRRQTAQILPAQRQYVGAAQALAVVEGDKALEVVLFLQQLGKDLPASLHPEDGGTGGQAAQEAGVHLADAFSVHDGRLLSGGKCLCCYYAPRAVAVQEKSCARGPGGCFFGGKQVK